MTKKRHDSISDGQIGIKAEGGEELAKPEIILTPDQIEIKNKLRLKFLNGKFNEEDEEVDFHDLPEEVLQSPEMQEAGRMGLDVLIGFYGQMNNFERVKNIIEYNSWLSADTIDSVKNEHALGGLLTDLFLRNDFTQVKQYVDFFQLSPEFVQQAGGKAVAKSLERGQENKNDAIQEIIKFCELSPEILEQAGKEALIYRFIEELRNDILMPEIIDNIIKFCKLSPEVLQQAGIEALIFIIPKSRNLICIEEVINTCRLSPSEIIKLPQIRELVEAKVIEWLNIDIGLAIKLKDYFCLPISKDVQDVIKDKIKSLVKSVKMGYSVHEIVSLKENFLSDDVFQAVVREAVLEELQAGNVEPFFLVTSRHNKLIDISEEDATVQLCASQGMLACLKKDCGLSGDNTRDASRIKRSFSLSNESVEPILKEGFLYNLRKGRFDYAGKIIEELDLEKTIMSEPEALIAAKEGVLSVLKTEGKIKDPSSLLPDSIFSDPEIKIVAEVAIFADLTKSMFDDAKNLALKFDLLNTTIDSSKTSDQRILGVIRCTRCKTIYDLFLLFNVYEKSYSYFKSLESNQEWILSEDDLKKAQESGLNLVECHYLKQAGLDFASISFQNEEECKKYFEALEGKKDTGWEDVQNISGPFRAGAEIFGYKKMFQYVNRDGLSRHDALHNFRKIIEVYNFSGLSADQFYGNILQQVQKDDASYEPGTAHHKLNSLANNINLDFPATITKAKEYGEIAGMQELVEGLGTVQDIFASWKNLKKYADLCDLLGKKEILNALQELKKQSGKERLYKYIETLAFHPNIDMKAVFQFWRDPEEFLDVRDAHSANAHESKKPSNYIHIPNLDLSAEDLRDALVEGRIDALQAFEPLEIEYELPVGEQTISTESGTAPDLRSLIKKAVGSRQEGTKGEAKDPIRLFNELNRWAKKYSIDLRKYLAGEIEIDEELAAQAKKIIENTEFGLPVAETIKYRVKINLKSDPDGVVAGNDTACCMPFGSGKNNVYTYNPICTLLTVQQERGDGTWRTVAQSVLTKDKDVKRKISEVLELMQSANKPSIKDVLPDEILDESQFVLACDNVELAPIAKGHRLTEAQIELLYRDFMFEYMKRYAKKQNLDSRQIVIGKGYSDSLTHLPQIENTFAPAAPVAYSDKHHSEVYQLIPQKAKEIRKKIIEHKKPELVQELHSTQKGVSLLTFEDAILVSYIEGKAYESNQTLIQYLHNMENGLIAKDINNTAKNRPNMSIKYAGEDGRVHGYMLAYEGRLNDEEASEENKGQPIIYVSDIASDLTEKGTGHALMLAFLEQYKHFYVDQGNPVPIYAQAREQTSYAIIKKNLKKYGEQVGLDLEMEEVGEYQHGDDIMHKIIIRVKK